MTSSHESTLPSSGGHLERAELGDFAVGATAWHRRPRPRRRPAVHRRLRARGQVCRAGGDAPSIGGRSAMMASCRHPLAAIESCDAFPTATRALAHRPRGDGLTSQLGLPPGNCSARCRAARTSICAGSRGWLAGPQRTMDAKCRSRCIRCVAHATSARQVAAGHRTAASNAAAERRCRGAPREPSIRALDCRLERAACRSTARRALTRYPLAKRVR